MKNGLQSHEVRRDPEQEAALVQAFPDQAPGMPFEVAQAAVDQLAGAAGGAGRQRGLFQHQHGITRAGRRLCHADAVNAATDDHDIEMLSHSRSR